MGDGAKPGPTRRYSKLGKGGESLASILESSGAGGNRAVASTRVRRSSTRSGKAQGILSASSKDLGMQRSFARKRSLAKIGAHARAESGASLGEAGEQGASPVHAVLKMRNGNLWGKVRGAVRIAGAIGRINKETEKARRVRIKRHWELVRQIARAAISLTVLSDKRDHADSHIGIRNYTRFCEVLKKHPSSRTRSDLKFLMQSTKHLAFFSKTHAAGDGSKSSGNTSGVEISEMQHVELCRTMQLLRIEKAQEFIFREGEPGEEFFIVLEGSVAVKRMTGKATVNRTVARLEAGASFGELALTGTSVVRTASIVTLEPSAFLKIHKSDYTRILRDTHQEQFEAKLSFLRRVSALEDLSEEDIFNIGVCLQIEKVRVGAVIIKEGAHTDPLRFFIIVKRGEVELRKRVGIPDKKSRESKQADRGGNSPRKQAPGTEMSLCVMGPTESLCDHRSLVGRDDYSGSYPFTVVANTIVEYFCVSKHDMFGKISREGLLKIRARISKIPDERTARNAHAVSQGWQQYKADLIDSIIANRRRDNKNEANLARQSEMHARTLEAQLLMVKSQVSRRADQRGNQRRSTRAGGMRLSNTSTGRGAPRFSVASVGSAGRASPPRHRASMCDAVPRRPSPRTKRRSTIAKPRARTLVALRAGLDDPEEGRDAAAPKVEDEGKGSALARPARKAKPPSSAAAAAAAAAAASRAREQRQQYARAAQEMEEFLADGFTLTRSVYGNALSHGARFYCKSVFWA